MHVDNCHVSAAVDESLSHDETQAASAAGDDSSAALEGEAGESALEMPSSASLGRTRRGQVLLTGVLPLDALISTGELALMLARLTGRTGSRRSLKVVLGLVEALGSQRQRTNVGSSRTGSMLGEEGRRLAGSAAKELWSQHRETFGCEGAWVAELGGKLKLWDKG